jgi:SpoVK/Ycf46/Vps4 family AAA+-type ATPase
VNKELLKRIARSFLQHDEKAFLATMRQLISAERRQGHIHLANELTKILSNGKSSEEPSLLRPHETLAPSPLSKRENVALIDVRHTDHQLDEIILAEETGAQISRFLAEYAKREELAKYGLKPRLKLLFFGPPGNGKTLCAEIVATELHLPLFYVRFDSLVASYLGETAANLRRVFDFAVSHTGVLLLDEFDAIGKSRDDREEVGELKRVVNSFLQLLDSYTGRSPIIATTNYEKLLDYALWRRFDSLVYFPQATEMQIEQYLQLRLSAVHSRGFDLKLAAQQCQGMSYADIALAFTDAIKSMILSGEKTLTYEMFMRESERLKKAHEHKDSRVAQSPEGGSCGRSYSS